MVFPSRVFTRNKFEFLGIARRSCGQARLDSKDNRSTAAHRTNQKQAQGQQQQTGQQQQKDQQKQQWNIKKFILSIIGSNPRKRRSKSIRKELASFSFHSDVQENLPRIQALLAELQGLETGTMVHLLTICQPLVA